MVVSNQSGIGRGYYYEKDLFKLEKYIKDSLYKIRARIDKFYYAFYFKNSKKKFIERIRYWENPWMECSN